LLIQEWDYPAGVSSKGGYRSPVRASNYLQREDSAARDETNEAIRLVGYCCNGYHAWNALLNPGSESDQ
jgi:hypothetical protein